jgi:thioredoxin 1
VSKWCRLLSQVINSSTPVVVDFSATWCGPCKMLTPRLDAVVAATNGAVHLAIVDIDDLGDLALEHGVQGCDLSNKTSI